AVVGGRRVAGLNVSRSDPDRFAETGSAAATVNLPVVTCASAAAARMLATEIEARAWSHAVLKADWRWPRGKFPSMWLGTAGRTTCRAVDVGAAAATPVVFAPAWGAGRS
ncbi:hypothetical protein, partial [Mycobacterium sp. KBS0706]|uniref:hypothetical protein n=1 Tax=Mycobacterium sp. KBS0706 TaxID=2578109 RepID=UPI001C8F8C88